MLSIIGTPVGCKQHWSQQRAIRMASRLLRFHVVRAELANSRNVDVRRPLVRRERREVGIRCRYPSRRYLVTWKWTVKCPRPWWYAATSTTRWPRSVSRRGLLPVGAQRASLLFTLLLLSSKPVLQLRAYFSVRQAVHAKLSALSGADTYSPR